MIKVTVLYKAAFEERLNVENNADNFNVISTEISMKCLCRKDEDYKVKGRENIPLRPFCS